MALIRQEFIIILKISLCLGEEKQKSIKKDGEGY